MVVRLDTNTNEYYEREPTTQAVHFFLSPGISLPYRKIMWKSKPATPLPTANSPSPIKTARVDSNNLGGVPTKIEGDYPGSRDDEDGTRTTGHSTSMMDMPLFMYHRVKGDLPRRPSTVGSSGLPFVKPCTCTIMGKVLLNESTFQVTNSTDSSEGTSATSNTPSATSNTFNIDHNLWRNSPIMLTAYGFQDGQIIVVDSQTGASISASISSHNQQFQVREGQRSSSRADTNANAESIVGLSFDASGTFLAAIDRGGACAIFEIKYSIEMRQSPGSSTNQTSSGMFSSLVSAFRGTTNSGSRNESGRNPLLQVPTLVAASVQTHRVKFPESFGVPTCIAIDPSYKRKREKSFLTGFSDGKLVLTKRGFVFQRRNDTVVYQSSSPDGIDQSGIQGLVWRGDLIAWADESGVRLMDTDQWVRIAHIDRPTGARPSLYPTIAQLVPSLVFETSRDLLVAWGDCLLSLRIICVSQPSQHTADPSPSLDHATGGNGNTAQLTRRRHVECTMAWELDCVATGAVPFDSKHVAVLGLVPRNEGDSSVNDVELQLISREDGSIVLVDLLPVTDVSKQSEMDSLVTHHSLLSSFSVSRMEDGIELYEEGGHDDSFDPLQGNIFARSSKKKFVDAHLRWNVEEVDFNRKLNEHTRIDDDPASDDDSIDSDDYSISMVGLERSTFLEHATAPIMTVCTKEDTFLVKVRDLDDAVSYALNHSRTSLALKYVLTSDQILRRHSVESLVDKYLLALLRMDEGGATADREQLSLRRMRKAASSMPLLLGGKPSRWEKWTRKMEDLPGALFVLRPHLPVRDPKLQQNIYTNYLVKMLDQLINIQKRQDDTSDYLDRAVLEAEQHCLCTIACWGVVSTLKELIRHFTKVERDGSTSSMLPVLKDGLEKRLHQTASCYLNFEVPSIEDRAVLSSENSALVLDDHSLFDVAFLETKLDGLLASVPSSDDSEGPSSVSRFALNAKAWVLMMQNRHDEGLGYLLEIGHLENLSGFNSLKDEALSYVNSASSDDTYRHEGYQYLLPFIEYKGLHEALFNPDFLPFTKKTHPMIALLRLVGLSPMQTFLLKHVVSPRSDFTPVLTPSRTGTMPLDAIAETFSDHPEFLLWFIDALFKYKKDIFVNFPSTTLPPKVISDLHSKGIDLYIQFSELFENSAIFMSEIDLYNQPQAETPLLAFLKVCIASAFRNFQFFEFSHKNRRSYHLVEYHEMT